MDCRLRIATTSDSPGLGRVHVACWHETYAGILPSKMLASLSAEERATAWEGMLNDPASFHGIRVYLAEQAGMIVGFGACCGQTTASLASKGFDGEFSSMYLLRSVQCHGLGTKIMHAMASDLTDRGFNGASLWVLRDNKKARRFYERIGGNIVGRKETVAKEAALAELAYGWTNLSQLAIARS